MPDTAVLQNDKPKIVDLDALVYMCNRVYAKQKKSQRVKNREYLVIPMAPGHAVIP